MLAIIAIYTCAFIILLVSLFMSSKKLRNIKYNSDDYIVTVYQYTEIVIGTIIFFLLFLIYQFIIYGTIGVVDLMYTALAFGFIFSMGKMVGNWVNYNDDD